MSGTGEMAQLLGTPTAPAEDPGANPSTHVVVHIHQQLQFMGSDALSDYCEPCIPVVHKHT